MKVRIGIGGIWHETNTFSAQKTTLDDFKDYQFVQGDDLLLLYQNTNTEIGGFIGSKYASEFELVPTLFAAAVPSGTIAEDVAMFLCGEITSMLQFSGHLDAIFMSLHGAAVAENIDDLDGYLLEQVSMVIDHEIPIVCTLDYHANISKKMLENASVLIGYDTFPHLDMAERGVEAAYVISKLLQNNRMPYLAYERVPILTSPLSQQTDHIPMIEIMEHLKSLEIDHQILCGSVAMGFPYSDVNYLGASIFIYGYDRKTIKQAAKSLFQKIWKVRRKFLPSAISIETGVQQAIASSDYPVVIVEAADNIGGGSSGDAAQVLAELIHQQAHNAVIVIADSKSVETAANAGVGNSTELNIGGKTDKLHGTPVHATVKVKTISNGKYTHKGSYMTGYVTSMGKTAVVEIGGITIVLTSRRSMPFDAEQLRCVGIEPKEQYIIVVKSAIAWKAAFGDIAKKIIVVDSAGACPIDLKKLTYKSRPKPIYPLD